MMKDDMKKFVYWVAPSKREGNLQIRCKTRKEANARRHKSYNWEAQKVVIHYENMLDLITQLSGSTTLNQWEN